MQSYLLKRVLNIIPIIFLTILITILLLRMVPGDPVDQILGEYASFAEKEVLREQLGLKKPLPEQIKDYSLGVLKGDFGNSLVYHKAVTELIFERFPATLQLAFLSILLALILGIPTGALAAFYKDRASDRVLMTFSLIGVATPNFWLGPLLIIAFSIKLNLLPVSGYDSVAHYVLPVVTMGTALMAIISRVTRNSLLFHMEADYVRTARAKGLSYVKVLWVHVLKNSILPVVTIVSLQFSVLLTGTVVTESIFDWPGIGSLVLEALRNRDYPLIQGCVLFFCLSYSFISLITDILYKTIDPRINFQERA